MNTLEMLCRHFLSCYSCMWWNSYHNW